MSSVPPSDLLWRQDGENPTGPATRSRDSVRLDRQLQLVFAAGLLVLLAIGAISFRASAVSEESELWVQHTYMIIGKLQELHIAVETMETTTRGFLLLNDMSRLESFDDKAVSSVQLVAEIRRLTADNPVQRTDGATLEAVTTHKVRFMQRLIGLRRSGGQEAASALIRNGEGLRLMLEFQKVVFRMRQEELRLLNLRLAEAERRQIQSRRLVLLVSAVGFLLAAAAVWQFRRETLRRNSYELALRSSEATFRGLLEAAPDAMVVVDDQSRIVLLNARTEIQFGYLRDELLGQSILRILPAGLATSHPADSTDSPLSASLLIFGAVCEAEATRKDASCFPVEMVLSPLAFGEGTLVTAAIRDVSERKLAEARIATANAELERSNGELRRFAYIASHDLQEPLRTVASYTELLSRRYRGRLDSDADEFIHFAVDGCKRMKTLIQNLLDYSRIGEVRVSVREVDSYAAVLAAIENLRAAAGACQAAITCDPLPAVEADSMQLVQVFQNLIANAIRYRSDRPPAIRVSAQPHGPLEWNFSVADNGIGIDSQYFEKVFVLFQRLLPREQADGTGIGLALCKKIVEGFGGKIWVESEPGVGSTFHFTLPRAKAQSDTTENRPPEFDSLQKHMSQSA